MFAIIQNEKQPFGSHKTQQRLQQGLVCGRAQAEHFHNEVRHECRIAQRRQVDKPEAICKGLAHRIGNLDGQPCLAAAARARECDEVRAE